MGFSVVVVGVVAGGGIIVAVEAVVVAGEGVAATSEGGVSVGVQSCFQYLNLALQV